MPSRTYTVPTVSCDHCKHAIETEVAKVAGVAAVEVDIDAKTVRVDGDASVDAIRHAIDDAGYGVTGVTA